MLTCQSIKYGIFLSVILQIFLLFLQLTLMTPGDVKSMKRLTSSISLIRRQNSILAKNKGAGVMLFGIGSIMYFLALWL